MYLNSLYYQNVGPISNLKFDFKRNSTGVPCPLVIVGQNGSGKSILLSNIVDAFYEFAGIVYNNATEPDLKGYQYVKCNYQKEYCTMPHIFCCPGIVQ